MPHIYRTSAAHSPHIRRTFAAHTVCISYDAHIMLISCTYYAHMIHIPYEAYMMHTCTMHACTQRSTKHSAKNAQSSWGAEYEKRRHPWTDTISSHYIWLNASAHMYASWSFVKRNGTRRLYTRTMPQTILIVIAACMKCGIRETFSCRTTHYFLTLYMLMKRTRVLMHSNTYSVKK
jgi:hypothetical protein